MVKSPDHKRQSSPSSSAAAGILERVIGDSPPSSSSCKYKGVRKRKWGKYVSEIRLPNCRERIWLGSYDTAEKAARAFDAALFCLRGRSAKFNFPDNPPDIVNGRSMKPVEIQVAAARFAHAEPDPRAAGHSCRVEDADSQSDSLSSSDQVFLHAESPCPSVSGQLDSGITEIPLDTAFLDQFLNMGAENNISDFGLFPGFDEFSADFMAPPLPAADYNWPDNSIEEFTSQGKKCGSCWSFSTTGVLEGAHYLATGELVSLSAQQLVDCDKECVPGYPELCDDGCESGFVNNALEYTHKSGGLISEKDYPYTGTEGDCKFDKNKIVASVSNFSVVSIDDDQIAANLVKHGPLSVQINGFWMDTYVKGVSCPYICWKSYINHAVLLVGYGAAGDAPTHFKEKPYWIIKNSWGEEFGEKGYYKICRGHNVCGVESRVKTVTAMPKTS